MGLKTFVGWTVLGFVGLSASQLKTESGLKLSCSGLVVDRIDPIASPGVIGSSHLHQIVGGNSFNATMNPQDDPAVRSICTTCTLTDDFSNYWTAVMYFRSREGKYKRVRQLGALFHEQARDGGVTVYYFPHPKHTSNMTAFPRGFRMRNGHPKIRDPLSNQKYEIQYTCLQSDDTRFNEEYISRDFPKVPCPAGVLTTYYFPPCWDGVNLDAPDHYSHVAWPVEGLKSFLWGNHSDCPATHPVKVPMLVMEIRWDTREFAPVYEAWPEDGSQPFVWSFGDKTGYGNHADYLFGWRGDSLLNAFTKCDVANCGLPKQDIADANECGMKAVVGEKVNGWLDSLPGGVEVD